MSDTFVDDDDYTQIFGVASELGGAALWVGFCSVAAYLLLFGGLLDKLETMTAGTSYHLVLQRIYREIMMVGFCSFTFTILNQTNTELPFGLIKAFGFADICLFAMSSFFCLQGVFIMLASVRQAQNWNVASQIPAEELLHNMSVWELSHPLTWRARYFPFCPTREQVEFRILKSIFATAYNIKASHAEFDFSIFLRMTHENNIVRIIDISFKNWVYILLLTGFASLKLHFWNSGCSSEECEDQEDVKIFTICGSVYGFLSVMVWLWGRILELRLINSAGVEGVDDYSIFLMTEFRTEEHLSEFVASPLLVKDVISNFLKEKEFSRVKSKEEKYVRRHAYLKRVAGDVHREGVPRSISKRLTKILALDSMSGKCTVFSRREGKQCQGNRNKDGDYFDDIPHCEISEGGFSSDEMSTEIKTSVESAADNDVNEASVAAKKKLSSKMCIAKSTSDIDDTILQPNNLRLNVKPTSQSPENKPVSKKHVVCADVWPCNDMQCGSAKNFEQDSMCVKRIDSFENKLVGRGMSMIVKRNKKKILRMSSGGRKISKLGRGANNGE